MPSGFLNYLAGGIRAWHFVAIVFDVGDYQAFFAGDRCILFYFSFNGNIGNMTRKKHNVLIEKIKKRFFFFEILKLLRWSDILKPES